MKSFTQVKFLSAGGFGQVFSAVDKHNEKYLLILFFFNTLKKTKSFNLFKKCII